MLENGNTVLDGFPVWAITGSDGDIYECLVCFSSFINRRGLKLSEVYFDGSIVFLACYHFSFNLVKGESLLTTKRSPLYSWDVLCAVLR